VENKPHPARFFLYLANMLYVPFYKTKNQGTTPFDRPTLVALSLYGLYKGNFSPEKIIDMADDSIGATWILGGMSIPSSKTVGRVIDDILDNIDLIFMQILQLCRAFNLIGNQRAFIDGTKTKANASKHKAMSYEYLCKKIDNTEDKIEDLIKDLTECFDGYEDLGDEEFEELIYSQSISIHQEAKSIHREQLKQRQQAIFSGEEPISKTNCKLKTIAVDENQLELFDFVNPNEVEEVKETMDTIGHQASRLETMKEGKENLEEKYQKENGNKDIPDNKQINFTDPESQIMVTKHNGIQQCYNNFALVDEKANIILGTYTTNDPNDKKSLIPTIENAIKYYGSVEGMEVGVDSGFYSAKNMKYGEEIEIDLYISIPELKSFYAKDKFEYDPDKDVYICPKEQELLPPENPREGSKTRKYQTEQCLNCESQSDCTKARDGIRKITRNLTDDPIREAAEVKSNTEKGKEILKQRKSVAEPIWGNMQRQEGLIQLHYRGLDKASREFKLRCVMHNLRKLLKVFKNNPEARNEIENMGSYPSRSVA
jgi:transposase